MTRQLILTPIPAEASSLDPPAMPKPAANADRAQFLHHIERIGRGGDPAAQQLLYITIQERVRFSTDPRELIQIAWAVGFTRINDSETWQALSTAVLRHEPNNKPKWLATLLVAANAVNVDLHRIKEAFIDRMREGPQIEPRDEAKFAAAWRCINLRNIEVLNRIVDSKDPPHIQWAALARLGVRDPKANMALLQRVQNSLPGLSEAALVGLTKTATEYGRVPEGFEDALQYEVAERLNALKPGSKVQLAIYLSKNHRTSEFLLNKLAEEVIFVLGSKPALVSTNAAVQLLEQYSRRYPAVNPDFTSRLFQRVEPRLTELPMEDVLALTESLVHFNTLIEPHSSRLWETILHRCDELRPNQMVTAIWALSSLQETEHPLLGALIEKVKPGLPTLPNFALERLAWSLGALDTAEGPSLWRDIVRTIETPQRQVDATGALQLYQGGLALGCEIPEWLSKMIEQVNPQQAQRSYRPNAFERGAEAALQSLGFTTKAQQYVGGYVIDLIIELGGRKVAVECEGNRFHRIGGDRRRGYLGKDITRERALSSLGIETLHIPEGSGQGVEEIARFLSTQLSGKVAG